MKKILFMLFLCLFGNILDAFEYHFPNNGMKIYKRNITYDRERGQIFSFNNFKSTREKILEVKFESKSIGHQSILDTLEKIGEMPRDYVRFYEILKRHTDSDPNEFIDIGHEMYFPNGIMGFINNTLTIVDGKFRSALKRLKIGEEQTLLKIRLGIDDKYFKKEVEELDIPHIQVQQISVPATILMRCKRIDKQIANCWFVDEKGQKVEELILQWNISYPQDLAKKIQQETQEIKQAQAKRKRLLEKECPNLYRTWYNAQRGYYVDPALGIKAAQRFQELGCEDWVQIQ